MNKDELVEKMHRKDFTAVMTEYFTELAVKIIPQESVLSDLREVADIVKGSDRTFIVGNGGSNAIAGHVAEDWTKICSCPTVTFNDPALITCFANDYGWNNWIVEAIKQTGWVDGGNYTGIFISSSGQSENIIKAAKMAKRLGIKVITFSGFRRGNPLSKLGSINIHVSSYNYNIIETCHEAWLLGLCEYMK